MHLAQYINSCRVFLSRWVRFTLWYWTSYGRTWIDRDARLGLPDLVDPVVRPREYPNANHTRLHLEHCGIETIEGLVNPELSGWLVVDNRLEQRISLEQERLERKSPSVLPARSSSLSVVMCMAGEGAVGWDGLT